MSPRKATLISNPKTGRYASRRRPVQELAAQLESLGVTHKSTLRRAGQLIAVVVAGGFVVVPIVVFLTGGKL